MLYIIVRKKSQLPLLQVVDGRTLDGSEFEVRKNNHRLFTWRLFQLNI